MRKLKLLVLTATILALGVLMGGTALAATAPTGAPADGIGAVGQDADNGGATNPNDEAGATQPQTANEPESGDITGYQVDETGTQPTNPDVSIGMQFPLYSCGSASFSLSSREYNTMQNVNNERAARGISRMCVNGALLRASRYWSGRMAAGNFFAHGCFECRLNAFDYPYTFAQENLAYSANGPSGWSSYEVVQAWLRSPSHRQAMLNSRNREFGVGARANADWMFTSMDMGTRR